MDRMEQLRTVLRGYGRVVIALSGGVDSSFLLVAALEAIEPDQVLALTIASAALPKREYEAALELIARTGARHLLVREDVADIPGFDTNPPERCYVCKRYLFTKVLTLAYERGFTTVLDGTNADDLRDYRPGRRALEELGVKSPLAGLGFTKTEIRDQSRQMGIPGSDRPSLACLATRFPTGEALTAEKLARVDAAEEALRGLGFTQLRVRSHGDLARIELAHGDWDRLGSAELREKVAAATVAAGYCYATVDLDDYRMGRMNR